MADLKPCPFSGSTNLDDSGDVIQCLDNGVMGPKPADGETKEDAWNKRAEMAAEEPAEDAPDESAAEDEKDPEASANSHTTLASSREAHAAKIRAASDLRAELRHARATARAFWSDTKAAKEVSRQSIIELNKAKADLAIMQERAEKAEATKAKDEKDFNSAVARIVAANGHAPVPVTVDNAPNAKPKQDNSALKGKDRIAAHIAATVKF